MGLSALINPFKRFIVTQRPLAEDAGVHAEVGGKLRRIPHVRKDTWYIEQKMKNREMKKIRRGTGAPLGGGPGPERETSAAG